MATVEKVILEGIIRGGSADGQYASVKLNPQLELITAQGLPPYTEMSRRGLGWQAMNTSALAALVVRPSTVAMLTLWNGNPDAPLIIDRAWCFNLVSTAAEARYGMWACVHPVGMTKPTADITAIKSMSGKTAYTGACVVDTGATVADDGWFPISNWGSVEPTGVLPGGTIVTELAGRIVIPYTAGFSIQVVASVVGDTFTSGFSWYEVKNLPVNE